MFFQCVETSYDILSVIKFMWIELQEAEKFILQLQQVFENLKQIVFLKYIPSR